VLSSEAKSLALTASVTSGVRATPPATPAALRHSQGPWFHAIAVSNLNPNRKFNPSVCPSTSRLSLMLIWRADWTW
jgi:hypothetical protein